MSSVMLVDPTMLSDAPAAFRRYVGRYFAKKEIAGKTFLYAAEVLSWRREYEPHGESGKGRAPCHSVNLMDYKEGLEPNQSLNDWMRKAEGKFLWVLYGHTDPCPGDCDD